jgi:hypothetical protein
MLQFLETKGVEAMRDEVFRPRYIGDMSTPQLGPLVNISCAPDTFNQDFALNYILNKGKMASRKAQGALPPKAPTVQNG